MLVSPQRELAQKTAHLGEKEIEDLFNQQATKAKKHKISYLLQAIDQIEDGISHQKNIDKTSFRFNSHKALVVFLTLAGSSHSRPFSILVNGKKLEFDPTRDPNLGNLCLDLSMNLYKNTRGGNLFGSGFRDTGKHNISQERNFS